MEIGDIQSHASIYINKVYAVVGAARHDVNRKTYVQITNTYAPRYDGITATTPNRFLY